MLAPNPNLADLREQPVCIDDRGGDGRAQQHTPGFLVLYDNESQGYVFNRIVK